MFSDVYRKPMVAYYDSPLNQNEKAVRVDPVHLGSGKSMTSLFVARSYG